MARGARAVLMALGDLLHRHRWALWYGFCIILGIAVRLPALQSELLLDDNIHLAMVDGLWPGRAPWELGTYATGDPAESLMLKERGLRPWFVDDHYRMATFRPIPSVLHFYEYRLLGNNPLAMHLSTLLWWPPLVLAVGALFRKVLPAKAAALGVLLYVLAKAHTVPITWVANRCGWMATLFSVLAVLSYVKWREDDFRRGVWLTPLLFGLGMLCGEYAACSLAFLVGYELFCGTGRARARLGSLLPVFSVTLLFGVGYLLFEYGSPRGNAYVGPFDQPVAFATRILIAVPRLVVDGVLGVLPTLGVVNLVMAAVGTVGAFAFVGLATQGTERRRALWLLCAGVVAMLPVSAGPYGTRLNIIASVGVLGGLAAAIMAVFASQKPRRLATWRIVLSLPLALVALLGHLILAPMTALVEALVVKAWSRATVERSLEAPVLSDKPAIILVASELETAFYAPFVRHAGGKKGPAGWYVVSPSPGHHQLVRTSATEFTLRLDQPLTAVAMLNDFGDASRLGDKEHRVGPLRITVLPGTQTRLRVQLDEPLEQYRFVAVVKGRYQQIAMPKVGNSRHLAPSQLEWSPFRPDERGRGSGPGSPKRR